jgi:hypothetical protein
MLSRNAGHSREKPAVSLPKGGNRVRSQCIHADRLPRKDREQTIPSVCDTLGIWQHEPQKRESEQLLFLLILLEGWRECALPGTAGSLASEQMGKDRERRQLGLY